jgi:hypothetical protein
VREGRFSQGDFCGIAWKGKVLSITSHNVFTVALIRRTVLKGARTVLWGAGWRQRRPAARPWDAHVLGLRRAVRIAEPAGGHLCRRGAAGSSRGARGRLVSRGADQRGQGGSRLHDGAGVRERGTGGQGSIAPGKWADMVVLSRDVFRIPPEEIAQTEALLTIFDGQVVYRGTD